MPSFKKSLSVAALLLLIASPVIVLVERQNLYDWWKLRNYTASPEVEALARNTTMDPLAKKIFFVAHPELQQSTDFRASCTVIEQTIVLGCYRTGSGIFLYNVNDPRLNGVLEVTSAHEMLHAAYERLNFKEKDRINKLTAAAYASLTDDRIKKNVEAYRSRDQSIVPNELHSILGTEVRNLPPELENYYKKYFTDRGKIVNYSELYEAEFTSREAAVAAYDAQLKEMKKNIENLNASLDAQAKIIEQEDRRLQSLLNARDVNNYNAGIPHYQQLILAYNSDVSRLKKTIMLYNSIVDKRNSIVGEEQQLINAIDSSVPASK